MTNYSDDPQQYHAEQLEIAAQAWEAAAEAVLNGDETVVCSYEQCIEHAADCRELADE